MEEKSNKYRQHILDRLEWTLDSIECDNNYRFAVGDYEEIIRRGRKLWRATNNARVTPKPMLNLGDRNYYLDRCRLNSRR